MADLSRREMLKRLVVAGAVASWPVPPAARASVQAGEPFETLDAGEAETLQSLVARLIPADHGGPGALEAGAARYIDRALAGPLQASRTAYRDGLAALDRYAQSTKADRFSALSPDDQDALLGDLEANVAPGFSPSASAFFELARTHTIEGTFSDPAYGGNIDFIGWQMLGYPGLRTMVTPDLQRLDRMPPSRHVSAYDFPAFAAARARRTRGR
jgi:gluconate 2-dehydrogenase gamma chain